MSSLLWLRFEEKDGETLAHLRQQDPPWRMIRAFRNEQGEALAHLHNVSGGVLDRDHLRLRVEIGANAWAQLTTTGATRIYKSRGPAACSRQEIDVVLEKDAFLEYLPDPLIPFGSSRLSQETRIELAEGATLFWWETVFPGREASGEVFSYHSLRSKFEIRAEGQLIVNDKFTVEPLLRNPSSPARMGAFRYFSTFYICQPGRSPQSWRTLEEELGNVAGQLSNDFVTLWGVSTLAACGLAIRGVSTQSRDLTHGLHVLWSAAKRFVCGRDAAIPRKIY